MPTKFSEIYERAVFKFTDYSFLGADDIYKDALLQKYLLAAVADFQPMCNTVDLNDYDLELGQFNNELDNEVIEILSWGIAYYWISAKALNSKLLRNMIHNKDYTSYSPANLLKEITSLRDTVEQEFRGRTKTYSFRHGDIDTWKAQNKR